MMKKRANPLMHAIAVYADPWGEMQKREAIKAQLDQVRRLRPKEYGSAIVELTEHLGSISVGAALAAIAHEAGDDRPVVAPTNF
jgi:hypothetical protein